MLPHEFMDRNSSYSANSSSKSEDTLAFKCNPFKFNLELLLGLFFRPLIRKLLAILGLKSKVLCFSAKPRLPWIFLTLTKVPMLLSTRSWSKWSQRLSEVANLLLISKNFALTFNLHEIIAVHKNDFKNSLTPLIHHLVDGVCFRERHLGILQKINHLVNVNWPWQWWLPILALISISYIKLSFLKTLLLVFNEKKLAKNKTETMFWSLTKIASKYCA